MSNFKKYPSIEQFRNVVRNVRKYAEKNGIDYPKMFFTGTVKLHGTNAAIVFNPKTKEIFCQSRNNIITPENDNAGFAAWVEERKDQVISELLKSDIRTDELIYIYGEFSGGNIQKGVGITGLDKMFVTFTTIIGDSEYYSNQLFNVDGCYSIFDFKTFFEEIDFANPDASVARLQEITKSVEDECPVARTFGVENGTGEGVVWTTSHQGEIFRFKVKGEKHSVSKVKTLASVDVEKMKTIDDFVDYAATQNRFTQGLHEIGFGNELTQKNTGDFVRWVANDIIKEESDTLEENGLSWKDVASRVSKKASKWFLDNL